VKLFKGTVLCFRIFDVATEIDLNKAMDALNSLGQSEQFKLRKISRSMVVKDAPLVVTLGSWTEDIDERKWDVTAYAKIFSFGAISITLRFEVPNYVEVAVIRKLAAFLDRSEYIHNIACDQRQKIIDKIGRFMEHGSHEEIFEDYIIYLRHTEENQLDFINNLSQSYQIHELLLLDKAEILSEQTKSQFKNYIYQYSNLDIVAVDWNCAFICSEGDAQDIADVLEFGLCQLLELRYYDELLDQKLNSVYTAVQSSAPSIFNSQYRHLGQQAARLYIDISDVVEKVENSLKVIGDFYYAKIFRGAVDRFRIKDWQTSVDNKLSNLVEISNLFQNDIVARRTMWMEIIVIALIAVEVIPLIYKLVIEYF
jgi:hypothetical protein